MYINIKSYIINLIQHPISVLLMLCSGPKGILTTYFIVLSSHGVLRKRCSHRYT